MWLIIITFTWDIHSIIFALTTFFIPNSWIGTESLLIVVKNPFCWIKIFKWISDTESLRKFCLKVGSYSWYCLDWQNLCTVIKGRNGWLDCWRSSKDVKSAKNILEILGDGVSCCGQCWTCSGSIICHWTSNYIVVLCVQLSIDLGVNSNIKPCCCEGTVNIIIIASLGFLGKETESNQRKSKEFHPSKTKVFKMGIIIMEELIEINSVGKN